MITMRWNIYAEFFDGERQLLNEYEYPFVGNFEEVCEEADRLIANLKGVETVEYESLGRFSPERLTLPLGAEGMEER